MKVSIESHHRTSDGYDGGAINDSMLPLIFRFSSLFPISVGTRSTFNNVIHCQLSLNCPYSGH